MNETSFTFPFSRPVATQPRASLDTLEARFALRVAARLTERSAALSPDVTERLRFARELALERARLSRAAESRSSDEVAAHPIGRSLASLRTGRRASGWWMKLATVAPAFVLAAGLFVIQRWQDNTQISVAAEVDTALLSDDLPPTAYSDAGFAEFLKTPGE